MSKIIDSMLVSYKPLAACSGAAYDKRDVSGLVLVSSYHWCVDALVPVASQDGCPHQRRRRSRAVRGSPSRHGSAPRPHDRASARGGRSGPSTRTARRRAVARRKTARRTAVAAVPRPPAQRTSVARRGRAAPRGRAPEGRRLPRRLAAKACRRRGAAAAAAPAAPPKAARSARQRQQRHRGRAAPGRGRGGRDDPGRRGGGSRPASDFNVAAMACWWPRHP